MKLVGGTFNKEGGKPSFVVDTMSKYLKCQTINGGTLDNLNIDFNTNVLIWMPNIDNEEEKILPTIKQKNPKLLLVSSKRVIEKDYKESDVIGRLLATKSNLGIMIDKPNKYRFKLLDPLGNIWANTTSIEELCKLMQDRINFLLNLTRIRSQKVGEVCEFNINPTFISIVKQFGNEFTKYVNAINPNRFLGNAATRCSYGFPAVKLSNRVFVTRRNVDKTSLTADDFVEVVNGDFVGYYGDIKPSVDTPIQLKLFEHYDKVRYMIHGHVYVEDAPYTSVKLPCGSIEEYGEIVKLYPEGCDFTVNLLGHGFLAFASNLDYFSKLKLKGRPFPEE